MSSYKELFYNSQAENASAIENLEDILESLKRCMHECEDEVISEENKIIDINSKKDL